MQHPWQTLLEKIKENWRTQKHFSLLVWKKVSEVNELIKWKRNMTIQWDILLSHILWTSEKFRIHRQIDHDYDLAKSNFQLPEPTNIEINKDQKINEITKDSDPKETYQNIDLENIEKLEDVFISF